MSTLYLDPTTWDLVLDANGNIAVATEPYSLAQDAASQLRTFKGEVFYDTTQGIDYFGLVLSQPLNLALLRSLLTDAALAVPGIVAAQVFLSDISGRTVHGQVQITDTDGTIAAASF